MFVMLFLLPVDYNTDFCRTKCLHFLRLGRPSTNTLIFEKYYVVDD